MKRILTVLLTAVLMLAMCLPAAAAEAAPEIVSAPTEAVIGAGKDAVYTVEAEGAALSYKWTLTVVSGAYQETYDLTKADALNELRVMFPSQTFSGADTASLKINHVLLSMNGCLLQCRVSNAAGWVELRQPLTVVVKENAPLQATVKLKTEVKARLNTVIKLFCDVTTAEDCDILYTWYEVSGYDYADPKKLEEDGPILICGSEGQKYYYCSVSLVHGSFETVYRTAVSRVTIYVPEVFVDYADKNITLNKNEEVTLKAEYSVFQQKDIGKISFQWYRGTNNYLGTFQPIAGATKQTLTLKGDRETGKVNYFCEVINEPYYNNSEGNLEGTSYSNMSDDMPFVSVTYTGKTVTTEEPTAEITALPTAEPTNTPEIVPATTAPAENVTAVPTEPDTQTSEPGNTASVPTGAATKAPKNTAAVPTDAATKAPDNTQGIGRTLLIVGMIIIAALLAAVVVLLILLLKKKK